LFLVSIFGEDSQKACHSTRANKAIITSVTVLQGFSIKDLPLLESWIKIALEVRAVSKYFHTEMFAFLRHSF
jgi:hypothetical protein